MIIDSDGHFKSHTLNIPEAFKQLSKSIDHIDTLDVESTIDNFRQSCFLSRTDFKIKAEPEVS